MRFEQLPTDMEIKEIGSCFDIYVGISLCNNEAKQRIHCCSFLSSPSGAYPFKQPSPWMLSAAAQYNEEYTQELEQNKR